MKGAIIEKGEQCYTYLPKIFSAINNIQNKYNWLITDYEYFPVIKNENQILITEKYCWITGEKLSYMVKNYIDFQWWNWAVFTGFNKNIILDDILKFELPYADWYCGFWKNPVSIQHQLADIEITAWDSTCTLIISKDDKIVNKFMKKFSNSQDLFEYNNK